MQVKLLRKLFSSLNQTNFTDSFYDLHYFIRVNFNNNINFHISHFHLICYSFFDLYRRILIGCFVEFCFVESFILKYLCNTRTDIRWCNQPYIYHAKETLMNFNYYSHMLARSERTRQLFEVPVRPIILISVLVLISSCVHRSATYYAREGTF